MLVLTDQQERSARTITKELRAREAVSALREYEAEKLSVLARTARLRALRLAKESEIVPPKKAKRKVKESR
jgi:hypothetical protein